MRGSRRGQILGADVARDNGVWCAAPSGGTAEIAPGVCGGQNAIWQNHGEKIGRLGGKVIQAAPEFESCKKAAAQAKVPLKQIYEMAVKNVAAVYDRRIASDAHRAPLQKMITTADKFEALRAQLRGYGSCLVAYSGGVDSVFLARVAHDVLGARSLAVIADSPSLPRRELDEALAIANSSFPCAWRRRRSLKIPNTPRTQPTAAIFANTSCSMNSRTSPVPRDFAVIAYGENASDAGDFLAGRKGGGRIPGARAAQGCRPDEGGNPRAVRAARPADGGQAAKWPA